MRRILPLILAGFCLTACQTGFWSFGETPDDTSRISEAAPDSAPQSRPWSYDDVPQDALTIVGLPISRAAADLIIREEVGSRDYYTNHLLGRPHIDESAGAILIGFGYNLGAVTQAKFKADWGRVLTPAAFRLLSKGVGLRGSGDRAEVDRLLKEYRKISIPFDTAAYVFLTRMLPDHIARTKRSLPNTDSLHPHAFGALVSLVYNRGMLFARDGDRYREMRAIAAGMERMELDGIPGQFRSMARLWPGLRGLQRRRRAEGALFARGLEAGGYRATFAAIETPPTPVHLEREDAPAPLRVASLAPSLSGGSAGDDLSDDDTGAVTVRPALKPAGTLSRQ